MSDGKEVKRWFIRCFLRNGIEFADIEGPLTHSKIEVMPVADHDRIVAGLKIYASELELKIADLILFPDQESSLKTIAELRAEVEALKTTVENNRLDHEWPIVKQLADAETTIARQAKVIEKLKGCAQFYSPDQFPWSADSEFDNGATAEETLAELAAIERGES